MNGINTSFGTQNLYQNDGTQGSAKSDDKKQDNKNDSNVIKGAGLNLNQTDLIGQKMANAQKEALKKIMDTFSGEHAVDEEMDERRAHIKEIDSEIKDYQSEIRDLQDKEAELKERYQVADGSQEEADLDLLKKASIAEGRSMLSKEELEHVSELQKGGMTDYQKESMDYYKMESEYRGKIKELGKERAEDNGYLRAVHTERLKHHDMIDSQKEAAEILDNASDEATLGLIGEAVDHIDETIKDDEKDTDKKDIDKKEDKKADTKLDKETQSNILKNEAEKKVAEHKLAEDDIKGLVYDEQL